MTSLEKRVSKLEQPDFDIDYLIQLERPLNDEEYEFLKNNVSFFSLLKVEGIDTEPYTPAESRFMEECKRRGDWFFGTNLVEA